MVLGFLKPPRIIEKGVSLLVYALVNTLLRVKVIGEVEDTTQVTVNTLLMFAWQVLKLDTPVGKAIAVGKVTWMRPPAGMTLLGVSYRV